MLGGREGGENAGRASPPQPSTTGGAEPGEPRSAHPGQPPALHPGAVPRGAGPLPSPGAWRRARGRARGPACSVGSWSRARCGGWGPRPPPPPGTRPPSDPAPWVCRCACSRRGCGAGSAQGAAWRWGSPPSVTVREGRCGLQTHPEPHTRSTTAHLAAWLCGNAAGGAASGLRCATGPGGHAAPGTRSLLASPWPRAGGQRGCRMAAWGPSPASI